jgi:threonine/homoserine/homoserine lactone efflux protein
VLSKGRFRAQPAFLLSATGRARTFKPTRSNSILLVGMKAEHAFAFLIFSAVAAVTPGPSNVMLTTTGAVAGLARGLGCLFGVAAGMGVMMFAVAFGLGAAVLQYSALTTALKTLGALFLLWLSWKIASSRPAVPGAPEGRAVGFLGGFVFQWLNPKSWLVSTSASATFLHSDGNALTQAFWIGGLFFAVALICGFIWLAFGMAMRRMLRSPPSRRAFNVSMGALLAGSVILFLW